MKPLLSLLCAFLLCGVAAVAQQFDVDEEGFIRHWLLLGPIPVESSAAEEIADEQIKEEAKLQPKAGETLKVRDESLRWQTVVAEEYYLDLNLALGRAEEDKAEYVIGYLACIVVAPEELHGIQARLGSNDQGRLYLNGQEIFLYDGTRTIEADSDIIENITLSKGENHVVFKVINEGNNWQACLRFTDKTGKPLRNLKVLLPR